MIEKSDYNILEDKIYCAKCGSKFHLENKNGMIVLRCSGSDDGQASVCQTPMITWEDLAAAVNKVTTITDLHLDFLWEAIERVQIDGCRIEVTMEQIAGEQKSNFLRLQDYWLVQHSLHGDERAKTIIYSIHEPIVKRKLYYLARKSPLKRRDIEDLEQAIWLRTFQYLSSYNGQYRFWTWMRLLVKTEFCRMCSQKSKVLYSDEAVRIQLDARECHGKSNIDRWMDREHVSDLLSILSECERYVVVEYLFKHRQQKEIAVDMHVCRQKAHEVYQRALRKMREYELSEISKN